MTSNNPQISDSIVRDAGPEAVPDSAEREAILVMGMHRSGTSALTRVISLLGADLPDHLMPPKDGNNEPGFWESMEAYRLNDAILTSAGSAWDDWRLLNPAWFQSNRAAAFKRQAIDLLEREFAGSPLFVFKDPRLSRLLPFWLDVLEACGSQVKFVIPLRNPLEIAASLRKRDGFSPAKSHMLWLRHALDAEVGSRERPRCFVSYGQLLDDWRLTMSKLGKALDIAWPRWSGFAEVEIDRFLQESHRHHAIDHDMLSSHPEIAAWVKEAFESFGELQHDPRSAPAMHDLDAVRTEFDRASQALGAVLRAEEVVRQEAEQTAASRTAEAAEAKSLVAEQHKQVEQRDSQIRDLQRRLSAQSDELDGLNEKLAERNERLEALQQSIEETEAKNTELTSTLGERDADIRRFEADVRELDAVLAQRNSKIVELEESLADGGSTLQALRTRLAEEAAAHDRITAELKRAIADRERSTEELKRAMTDKSAAIDALRRDIQQRDASIVQLENGLAAREARLGEQEKAIEGAVGRCNQALHRLDGLQSDPTRRKSALGRVLHRHLPRALHHDVTMPPRRCFGRRLTRRQRRQVRRQAEILLAANLFDVDWYVEQYPDVVLGGGNPVLHWLVVGWQEGRNPNPMFDTAWYLAKNPDVARDGTNPLVHYLRYGAKEGRNPGPLFDGDWYLKDNPDVAKAGLNPLRHYLRFGRHEGRAAQSPDKSSAMAAVEQGSPPRSPLKATTVSGGKASATNPTSDHSPAGVGQAAAARAHLQASGPHQADNALLERIYRYKDIKAKRGKARVVVYTANIGNYDALVQHQNICEDWDYVCITDRAIPGIFAWEFRHADYVNADPVRTARYYKTHPHVLFPEYEYSIWVDSNIDIVGEHLQNAVERLILEGSQVASVPHPHWECIYTDAEKCIQLKKDNADTIREQVSFLQQHEYPEGNGLIETNVMFRAHRDPNVVAAMNEWWSVICRYSRRDQLSFNYVLYSHGLHCDSLFEDKKQSTRNHPDYRYYLHPGDSSHHYSYYTAPYFNRNLPALHTDAFEYGRRYAFEPAIDRLGDLGVDVIVPVYNALGDVKRCLNSIRPTLAGRARLLIADDASDEETAKWLSEFAAATPDAKLIRRAQNVGFTRNVNAAVRESDADFIILLNSDTVVSAGWIEKLMVCAYSAEDIGLVGPLSNAASWQSIPEAEAPDGQLAVNALPPGMTVEDVNTYLQEISLHPLYPRVHLLNGFCLGIKRPVFDAVGLFDEEGFPQGYGEEDDFCLKAHEAGFSLAVATHTYVYHAKSKSFGTGRRSEIVAHSWNLLRSRYGLRYLQNAIASSKRHPGLTNIRSLMKAEQAEGFRTELDPAAPQANQERGWSAIEVPHLMASYEAPQTTPYYEPSRPYRGRSDVELIAFYLPQFYPFEKNDKVWGKGFTEWTNVTRALPLFKGHHQPKLPDALGFYDTRLKETLVGQVELAKQHGIGGFCFHHYFFKDEPVMRVPLELFLANPDIDFPFCLHWANEPWTTTWTYTYREKSADTVIYDQEHTEENDLAFIRDAHRALVDPRYIRIDGRPLLMIYRPGLFPDIKATIARWRRYCRDNGIGDLHMVMVQTNAEGERDPRELGFDAAVEFPPHLIEPKYLHRQMEFFYDDFDGAVIDYQSVIDSSLNKPPTDYVRYRGLFPRWDNTPRKIRGTSIFVNDSPEAYREWLQALIQDTRAHQPEGQRMVFVNAWNEWAEGAFLEPDRKYGYAYLNAGARALENTAPVNDALVLDPADRIAIQIHAYHVDVFEHILEVLDQGFPYPADLLVSTSSKRNRERIAELTADYRGGNVVIRVFQNQGRDIAPFVVGFGDLLPGYAYALHLHTKKSSHGAEFSGWLDYLLGELVADRAKVERIFRQLTRPDVGIVFPHHYWRVKDRIRWGANLDRTNELLIGTGITLHEQDQPFFPSGSMFYFKPAALAGLFAKGLSFDDFAVEEGQIDGTLAHAIERSFCYFAKSAGCRSIMTSAV